ncbi:MAG: hypothetical protein HC819_03610 [Cyclobacteriaceae bacterium]|nr:hypothetical protein [Cyclobacteriaceae bacterium]
MKIKCKLFLLLVLSTFWHTQIFAQHATEISPKLVREKWDAKWIAHPRSNEQFGVYNFRKAFELKQAPKKFIIHISADNRYWLYINGKRICTGPAKGDVANWNFESLEISGHLRKGTNVLAVTVWNQGDYRAAWQQTYKTGLVVQGNSSVEAILNTNETWKVAENNAYYPLYDGYKFIGAREAFLQ